MLTTRDKPEAKIQPAGAGVGQRVLWAGEPKQGILFTFHDYFLLPWSLGFDYTFISLAYHSLLKGEYVGLLFSGLFSIFGYFITIGRFFYDRTRRANISYEIINDTIVIYRKPSFFSDPTTTLSLHSVPNSILIDHKDGTGTIIFLDRFYDVSSRMRHWRERLKRFAISNPSYVNFGWVAVFERIENAESVFALIRKIQRGEGPD